VVEDVQNLTEGGRSAVRNARIEDSRKKKELKAASTKKKKEGKERGGKSSRRDKNEMLIRAEKILAHIISKDFQSSKNAVNDREKGTG